MIFTIRKEIVGFLFIYFFHLFALNAQSTEEKITKIAADYFELTRENFHIQFNKINYLVGESIWFKGFVLDKNKNLLSTETTNVYLDFLNTEGNKIETNLLYAEKIQ